MDFQELGLTLRQEREKKGLTVEMVMEATKISRTNIVAMESGDRDTLPHPVYTKGFVKSYARFLGLDPIELSMAVDQEYIDEIDGPEEHIYEVEPAAEKAFQAPETPDGKGRSKWPLLLVLALLVAVGVLLFMNLNGDQSTEEAKQSSVATESVEQEAIDAEPEVAAVPDPEDEAGDDAAAQESDAELSADNVNSEGATDSEPATEPEAAAEDVVQEAEPTAQTEPAVQAEPEKPEPVVEQKPEEKPVAVKPAGQKYDHELVIRATTEKGCWIGLWKGDETKMYRDYVLSQGEPLRLKFNTLRRIRIGNVAGVTVTYNGQPYELDGAVGNIQTLRFGE